MNHETSAQKTIEIGLYKAIAIVATAVLTTAIGTAFTLFSILNADHFTLVSYGTRLDAVEAMVVPRNELQVSIDNVETRLDRIENKLDRIIER